ncbi:MAG: YbjN domain-containing protein [Deltaproteobacteria bacterium]|nr:YbjN domain-containing protein [Deltaproteobacteria bacterium]MBW2052679.1 YbjN domain-containing protein [Deltaproteobacteria bacterium]MBW2141838.1 YbjN domain-containing protein [Deltaproteobacteria bacterium]MBW2323627.1 YbjN domain-containing protein [Deltaproteobacteria bacterium]
MSDKFELVKEYLIDMGIPIISEDPAEELVVISDEDNGVKDLVIDCEEPILVLEQVIMQVPEQPGDLFKRLLQMNRELVHGAFVLDEEARLVLFRDTLQLENLDRNELEASIQALGLALVEFSSDLMSYVKR